MNALSPERQRAFDRYRDRHGLPLARLQDATLAEWRRWKEDDIRLHRELLEVRQAMLDIDLEVYRLFQQAEDRDGPDASRTVGDVASPQMLMHHGHLARRCQQLCEWLGEPVNVGVDQDGAEWFWKPRP